MDERFVMYLVGMVIGAIIGFVVGLRISGKSSPTTPSVEPNKPQTLNTK